MMSYSVAMHCSHSNQSSNQGFQDLFMFNGHADLMELKYTQVVDLLEYKPTPNVEELVEVVIEELCGLLATLTQDNTVRKRVPEQHRSIITFETFVRDIFNPYLLQEVGKHVQEAQGHLDNFVEEKQLMFQEEIVNSGNS